MSLSWSRSKTTSIGAVGVARLRPNEPFGDVNAFAGGFGLFFYDKVESE
ncbi:hypothetical protein AE413_003701 [Salmonella enterica subsp. enterica]|nr:hypothetical protein [Salmonella enterica subsp. enterica serovar Lexington]